MKTNFLNHMLVAAVLAVATTAYADFQVTFDSPAASTEASGAVVWSAGPAGWAGAGCIQDTNLTGGWGGGNAITLNLDYGSGHQPNIWAMDPNAGHVSFDVVVNATSFNTDGQWWQIFIAGNSNPNGWTQLQLVDSYRNGGDTSLQVFHIDKTFADLGFTAASATAFSYYQLNIWANSDNPNPINFYIDNVNFYTATTVHPTNDISKVTGPRGLIFKTSTNVFSYDIGQEQYQRQNVRTATTGYGWLGSPDPLTYSLTITNYPDVAHSNFQTHIWLVDGVTSANAPDYNNPNVVSLSISQNADGTANGHLAYKVNQPSANSMFYADGNLGDCFSTTVLGTWSLTFTNNDYVIVTSPDGTQFSTNLTSGDGGNFSQPLTIYIDSQAILTNNIGQQAVFSKFQVVSNSTTLLSDNFSSGVIDASKWLTTQAEDPANVYQIPTTAAYKLTWSLPDGGFSLQATGDLINWANPGLSAAIIAGRRTAYLSEAYVATNSAKYFRLSNP